MEEIERRSKEDRQSDSNDEHSRTLLKISGLEHELKGVIEEIKDIEAKTLSDGKRLVNVGATLFPKTTISLGDSKPSF